jgi:hypothetical protein
VRVLGVNCTSDRAYLSVAEDGEVVESSVEIVNAPMLGTSSEQLEVTCEEFARVLAELRPDEVVLLLPEQGRLTKRTHSQHMPRIALETVVRLASVQAGSPIDLLARPTLRSQLGVPFKGDLASHVDSVVDSPVGKHWKQGRDLAALAALAGKHP